MADETIKALAVQLALDDGSFQEGIKNLQKNMSVIESEFKANTAGVKDWGKNLDSMKSHAQALSDKINVQKQVITAYSNELKKSEEALSKNSDRVAIAKSNVDKMKQAYDESAASTGKNSEATKALKVQLDAANKELSSAETVIKRNNTSVQNNTIKLNESKAALGKMEAELKASQREIDKQSDTWIKLANQVGKASEKIKTVGEKVSGVGQKLTTGVTAPVVAAGTAAFKLASDYNEAVNKIDVAFGASAGTVKKWSETTLESYGLASGSALDAAANYGDMATAMGFTTGTAAEMAKTIVGLSADMSSFKNIPIAESQTALNSIFTGETESLKKLGIVMTEANLQNYATTQGIKTKISAMSEQEKVQLRYNYILSVTKNSQGDFARTSESAANQTRTLGESAKELGETFGKEVVPALTPVIKGAGDALKAFGKLNDGTKKTIVTVAAITAAVGPAVLAIGKIVEVAGKAGASFSKVVTHLKGAQAATEAAGAASSAAASKISGIGAAFKSALGPIALATVAIGAAAAAYEATASKIVAAKKKVIDDYYSGMEKANSDALQSQLDELESEKTNEQNSLNERTKSIDAYYDQKEKDLEASEKSIKKSLQKENEAYQEAYQSKVKEIEKEEKARTNALTEATEATISELEKQDEAYKNAHDRRIKELDEEQEKRIQTIDAESATAINKLKGQINALDAQTSAEERARTNKENEDKKSTLIAKINTAKTIADRVQAQKELDDFLSELDQKQKEEARANQKQLLNEQISAIEAEATKKKQAVQNEITLKKSAADTELETQQSATQAKIKLINAESDKQKQAIQEDIQNQKDAASENLKTQQESVNDRLDAMDGYVEAGRAQLEQSRADAKAVEEGKTADLIEQLNAREDELQHTTEAANAALEAEKEVEEQAVKATAKEVLDAWGDKIRSVARQIPGLGKIYDWAASGDWVPDWARRYMSTEQGKRSLDWLYGRAVGDNDWIGGPVRINEEGGEILNLPRHTQIIPHDVSMEMARNYGGSAGQSNYTFQISVPIYEDGKLTKTLAVTKTITPEDLAQGRTSRRFNLGAVN